MKLQFLLSVALTMLAAPGTVSADEVSDEVMMNKI
jgi:hypothetical protein